MPTITLMPGGQRIECEAGESLLESVERAGYAFPNDCRAGHCGTCRTRILNGEVDRGLYMPMALSEAEVDAGVALPCVALPLSDDVEIEWQPSSTAGQAGMPFASPHRDAEFVVVSKHDRTPEIVEVSLRPTMDRFRYLPGQYVEVASFDGERRPYSIANVPRPDGSVTLHVARAAGGKVSGWLHDEVGVGETVLLSGPYGTFVGDPTVRGPVLCLAGGSGLAPILALTEAALGRGYTDPVTLLYSARTSADVYAREVIDEWEHRFANFRYVRTLTKPAPEDAPPHGRAPEVLSAMFGNLGDHQVFIAGSPAFVTACREAVERLGACLEKIHVERYFPVGRTDNVAA